MSGLAWIRLDTTTMSHPKMLGLSDKAKLLHIAALCYSGRYLTDGLVPRAAVGSALEGRPADAAALVKAGLWEAVDQGWQINDWRDYNPTRASIERVAQMKRHAACVRWHEQPCGRVDCAPPKADLRLA